MGLLKRKVVTFMSIREYSLSRDSTRQLSPSFKVREFACKSSQHLLGRAADFYVEGVDVATVADYAETLLPGRGGIGRYPKDAKHSTRKTGWVHIDTRANKSRWSM